MYELRQLRDGLFVLEELVGGDHGDAVPGADLVAEGAADTAGEVDGADLEAGLVARAGDGGDAIDGADGQAGFTAGAVIGVDDRQFLRNFFAGTSFSHGKVAG